MTLLQFSQPSLLVLPHSGYPPLRAWNIYLSVCTAFNPSCAPDLIRYQCIITSANSKHSISEWLNYDIKFCTKAANNPFLRWDIRDMDLWLECMTTKAMQLKCWPCPYCGATNHFSDGCLFRPSSSSVGVSNAGTSDTRPNTRQPAPGQLSHPRRTQQPLIWHVYNNAGCHQSLCKYRHNVCTAKVTTRSGAAPPGGSSDVAKPLLWTPLRSFVLELELSNHPKKPLSDKLSMICDMAL